MLGGRWGRAVAAATALAAAVATASPAGAQQPERDTAMGSQIAKHEGVVRVAAQAPTDGIQGIDVSSYQGEVDWAYWWGQGKRFAYVKATESHDYVNPYFGQQYGGSAGVGMKRGAYHFADPNDSSGAAQANHFVDNGGGWARDGKTLPGVVDLEWNPYDGNDCYDKTKAQLAAWISEFVSTYRSRTGRYPVIYTSTSWWTQCVASEAPASRSPLWITRYNTTPGVLPAGWGSWAFWQYDNDPIDQNQFSGSSAALQQLVDGTRLNTTLSPTTIVYGSSTKFSGTLTEVYTGSGVSGAKVELQRRTPGSSTWSAEATTTTGSGGAFSFTRAPWTNRDYRAVHVSGSPSYPGPVSAVRAVLVRQRVSGAFNDSSVRRGTTVRFAGSVAPNHAGHSVYLQRYSGGSWKTVATRTLSSSSTYSASVTHNVAGTYTYRVYRPSDSSNAAGYSPTRKLAVS
jgi:GH25 family lysozyme M1 (1,4-beta-N-acetylmuramidase)